MEEGRLRDSGPNARDASRRSSWVCVFPTWRVFLISVHRDMAVVMESERFMRRSDILSF